MIIRELILMAIQKNLRRITIESDSQLIVNFINDKICLPKDIFNLVEDIRMISSQFRGIIKDYCHMIANKDADELTISFRARVSSVRS